ncbi:NTP transferase domain-containing protein [Ruficoccus amylovorans]|uniref:NTP transferase domain-containing protein n=1 Tax=Ruficoccus amylovorans TaxID=1804625 RepID=A0A842HB98_9BACT|nr:NTP transferase domain-containing protein [Ruficoccus amylovorans]MBC2593348.1 NTP transferase domain-containing protein [Ruficoccus amylovorans]
MKPTLLVLAAGMGSRYGGLKQLDPMGPNGETLLDYSLRDAAAAGFGKAVFVIRRDFAEAFRQGVGEKATALMEVEYAFQELGDLPAGYIVPEGRTKPWGTAHAIRAARAVVNDPFIAINADDYYGADAYARILAHLRTLDPAEAGELCMVGYPLKNTLSPHGSVNRGVCRLDGPFLQTVEEHTDIRQEDDGNVRGNNLAGERVEIPLDAPVSMNFWGFTPALFAVLEEHFCEFLQAHGGELKSECYIPTVVDDLIRAGRARCTVLPTSGEWFGVTYPADKPRVQERLLALG